MALIKLETSKITWQPASEGRLREAVYLEGRVLCLGNSHRALSTLQRSPFLSLSPSLNPLVYVMFSLLFSFITTSITSALAAEYRWELPACSANRSSVAKALRRTHTHTHTALSVPSAVSSIGANCSHPHSVGGASLQCFRIQSNTGECVQSLWVQGTFFKHTHCGGQV